MDEQGALPNARIMLAAHSLADDEWLKMLNADRQGVANVITPELFEVVMDRLEKEWFTLVRSSKFILGCCFLTRISDQEYTSAGYGTSF
jgi:hypothetical protein